MGNLYTVINVSDLGDVDFSQILTTSADTVSYNNDGTLVLLKCCDITVSSLSAITKVQYEGRDVHTIDEILDILDSDYTSTGWAVEDVE